MIDPPAITPIDYRDSRQAKLDGMIAATESPAQLRADIRRVNRKSFDASLSRDNDLRSVQIMRLGDNMHFNSIKDAVLAGGTMPHEYASEHMRLRRALKRGRPYRGEMYSMTKNRRVAA